MSAVEVQLQEMTVLGAIEEAKQLTTEQFQLEYLHATQVLLLPQSL